MSRVRRVLGHKHLETAIRASLIITQSSRRLGTSRTTQAQLAKLSEKMGLPCKDGCCSQTASDYIPLADKPKTGDCLIEDCCTDKGIVNSRSSIDVADIKATPLTTENKDNGCSQNVSECLPLAEEINPGTYPVKTCCADEGSLGSRSTIAITKIEAAPPTTNMDIVEHSTSSTLSTLKSCDLDLEKGFPQVEHVTLNVQGMTCTGCERKLHQALESIPSISNVQTSLVLAQADFDLNEAAFNETIDITKLVERITGFVCIRITQVGKVLDIVVCGDSNDFIHKSLPCGVIDLAVLDKNTLRVTYDPRLVGARDLLADPSFLSAKLAPLAAPPTLASSQTKIRQTLLRTIISTLLTIPVLILAWAPLMEHYILYGAISLGLATIIQIFIAGPFYPAALRTLIYSRMVEMDLLVVLSTSAAYIYSVIAYGYQVAGKPLSTGEFFQTSTLLVTIIMIGRTLSAYAKQRAMVSISIESLQTPTALLLDTETGKEQEIDARLLQYQDLFKVLPEMSVVTDGVVMGGETEMDESLITGEATLVRKKPGMSVIAGSINYSSTLIVRLTRLPCENTIKTIGTMVNEAQLAKPKVQEIADRFAAYFVPIILVITVVVFIIRAAVGKAINSESATTACISAMTYAMSTLIVSCPCAVGLAVPMVTVIVGGVGARNGLILKSAQTIECARNITHIVFDKTGTLTQGKLTVVTVEYIVKKSDWLAPVILGLTTTSKHPVSRAIAAHIEAMGVQPSQLGNVVAVPGSGIEATWNGRIVRAGNPDWLGCWDSPEVQKILRYGLSLVCVSVDGNLAAVFGLKDCLRPDAIEVINELKKRSIDISIVSGDNQGAVQSIARQLDIPSDRIRYGQSPADKQAYVKQLLAKKDSVVAFCGDGTNDAAALAQASIGVHMNEGTEIAQSAADAVLMRPSLKGVLVMMDLSMAFYRRVVFNFTWSCVYNIAAILLAAGAFPHARIPPQFAGLGEIVSILPVIAVAMHLKWVKF